jgi:uncharacterized iron-regulated protein
MHFLPFLLNVALAVLDRVARKEKEIKDIQTRREEVKLPLFTNAFVENTHNLSELINEFSKVAEYKVSTQNQLHYCILTMNNLKRKL